MGGRDTRKRVGEEIIKRSRKWGGSRHPYPTWGMRSKAVGKVMSKWQGAREGDGGRNKDELGEKKKTPPETKVMAESNPTRGKIRLGRFQKFVRTRTLGGEPKKKCRKRSITLKEG